MEGLEILVTLGRFRAYDFLGIKTVCRFARFTALEPVQRVTGGQNGQRGEGREKRFHGIDFLVRFEAAEQKVDTNGYFKGEQLRCPSRTKRRRRPNMRFSIRLT
jgi:hypothetical protein